LAACNPDPIQMFGRKTNDLGTAAISQNVFSCFAGCKESFVY